MPKKLYLALVAVAVAAAPALGADSLHVAFRIKPGLWEFTDMPKVTGDTIVADVMLAHVPPAQRAQSTADMRKEMASPQKARECFTQPKFEQRISLLSAGCVRTVVTNAAGALDLRTVCNSQGYGIIQVTTQEIKAANPAVVTTTTHSVARRAGKTMTIDSIDTGRWVSAACSLGDVIQQVP
jgi:hypothetical protein